MNSKQTITQAQQAISLMDLTSLTDQETSEDIINLCHQAHSVAGNTAAICIYPRFIPLAKKTLKEINAEQIKVATVTNFPGGGDDIEIALAETLAAIAYGADEVDLVFPYRALKSGREEIGFDMVAHCQNLCVKADVQLKVIIESGELESAELIAKASLICIKAGADFIKTSTGKVPINATLEAAKVMLSCIKEHKPNVGFKAAGGVKNINDAIEYMALARQLLGDDYLTKTHFRFGASGLLSNLLATINQTDNNPDNLSENY